MAAARAYVLEASKLLREYKALAAELTAKRQRAETSALAATPAGPRAPLNAPRLQKALAKTVGLLAAERYAAVALERAEKRVEGGRLPPDTEAVRAYCGQLVAAEAAGAAEEGEELMEEWLVSKREACCACRRRRWLSLAAVHARSLLWAHSLPPCSPPRTPTPPVGTPPPARRATPPRRRWRAAARHAFRARRSRRWGRRWLWRTRAPPSARAARRRPPRPRGTSSRRRARRMRGTSARHERCSLGRALLAAAAH